MNLNDIIASVAIGLGFVQMYDSLQNQRRLVRSPGMSL